MKSQYLMGVDVGTQSAKVVIFDVDGQVICEGKQALRKMDIPAPLLAEHPDDDLWDALQIAFRTAMQNSTSKDVMQAIFWLWAYVSFAAAECYSKPMGNWLIPSLTGWISV